MEQGEQDFGFAHFILQCDAAKAGLTRIGFVTDPNR